MKYLDLNLMMRKCTLVQRYFLRIFRISIIQWLFISRKRKWHKSYTKELFFGHLISEKKIKVWLSLIMRAWKYSEKSRIGHNWILVLFWYFPLSNYFKNNWINIRVCIITCKIISLKEKKKKKTRFKSKKGQN